MQSKNNSRFIFFPTFFLVVLAIVRPEVAAAKGPYLVKDINPGPGGGASFYYIVPDGNGGVYLRADDGVHGPELWTSDGTEAGTQMVVDLEPGPVGADPQQIACAGGNVFFTVYRELNRADLFRSDGTATGTQYLDAYTPHYGDYMGIGNLLFFIGAEEGNHYNDELWKSDGTIAGTARVKDLNGSPLGSLPSYFTDVNGVLYFRTVRGPWKSDGTEAGTILLKEGVHAFELTNVNGKVFFRGHNDSGNPPDNELWITDGTTLGTQRVKDIFPGQSASSPSSLTAVGNRVFFNAKRQIGGPNELWMSDGTEEGTVMVDDQGGARLTNLNGTLYFWRWDAIGGYVLWKSDGTPQETLPVATISPPEVESGPEELIAVNGKLYFSADDGIHGRELWCYDPTFNSAFMVGEIRPGAASGGPNVLTKVGTTFFFYAGTNETGSELWAFDTREAVIPTISPTGAALLFVALLVAGFIIAKRKGGLCSAS